MKTTETESTQFTDKIPEKELASPSIVTLFKVIRFSIRDFFTERPGQIIISTILLLVIWGWHGRMEWLEALWPDWRGPGVDLGNRPVLIPGIPWDNELISFWSGAFLLVVIPMVMIKFLFRQPLSEYGLGLPAPGRRKLAAWSFLLLIIIPLIPFWLGTNDPSMRAEYPIYKPLTGAGAFILYELTYAPFFLAIEFIFRGYLLFGLAGWGHTDSPDAREGSGGKFYFGRYALVISMLPYIAWHLGKPVPEVWGAVAWGLAAGAVIYAVRSIWPVVIAHWLLNVFMDGLIAQPF
jgi:membrane protease YdiL (CAAX protease family)